jgi:biopolymer transport protein TolR
VTLTADGLVLLMMTEIAPDELIPRLQAIAAERENNRVFLRADGAIPYERVVQIMGALNAGGFNNIGLVTETGGPAFGAQPVR